MLVLPFKGLDFEDDFLFGVTFASGPILLLGGVVNNFLADFLIWRKVIHKDSLESLFGTFKGLIGDDIGSARVAFNHGIEVLGHGISP
jgi:hypothetical protein